MFRYLVIIIVVLFGLGACAPVSFTPKPPGYFRLDTPEVHQYQLFDMPGYPYTFEYPVYAQIEKDTAFFKEKADNPFWINISFPTLGGVINITYKNVASKDSFQKLSEDSYQFTYFHHQKADYINDEVAYNPATGITFILYTVGGNAASRYQFTATDSVKHFMLGALYFDVTPNADSLKPATDFLQKDIQHMLQTLKFR